MIKNTDRILIDKDNHICDTNYTYHDHEIEILKKILKDKYNKIGNTSVLKYKIKEAEKLDVKYENNVFESFDEWVERKSESFLLYDVFKSLLIAYENLPEYETVKDELSKSWWDFRSITPEFRFSTYNDINGNYVLSMNTCYSNSIKYLGTLNEFKKKFNTIPYECIFIANNMTPEQQSQLNELLSKHISFNDGQGSWGSYNTINWKVMYV